MRGKCRGALLILLGNLLVISSVCMVTALELDNNTYNGKMPQLLRTYFEIQALMAKDSTEGLAAKAQIFGKLTHEIRYLVADKLPPEAARKLEQIKKNARGLADNDLSEARKSFKIVSRMFVEYLEMVGIPDSLKSTEIFVFYCPMAESPWMQNNQKIANPFYGSIMPEAGMLEGKLQAKVTAAYNGF
ncbi:MAG: DUF3347 domain-containing protein [Candidatus Schekmanbacteria bacterium]|nr:DUF3347 domain-containing protein [Candidatus Schekmanbacteria bacterium]